VVPDFPVELAFVVQQVKNIAGMDTSFWNFTVHDDLERDGMSLPTESLNPFAFVQYRNLDSVRPIKQCHCALGMPLAIYAAFEWASPNIDIWRSRTSP
jgi:hypothetical protein